MVRDGIVIAEDKVSSLKRFKDDVKEVADGYDFGMTLEKFNDVKRATYWKPSQWKNTKRIDRGFPAIQDGRGRTGVLRPRR